MLVLDNMILTNVTQKKILHPTRIIKLYIDCMAEAIHNSRAIKLVQVNMILKANWNKENLDICFLNKVEMAMIGEMYLGLVHMTMRMQYSNMEVNKIQVMGSAQSLMIYQVLTFLVLGHMTINLQFIQKLVE